MAVTTNLSPSRHQSTRKATGPSQFQLMQADPQALDRLDIRFHWGHYGIQVLRCHLTTLGAGNIIQSHKHRDYEFHFIPSGTGSVVLEDGLYPVHAGMFYLTGPYVVHQQETNAWEPLDELCLHIDIVKLASSSDNIKWGDTWEIAEAAECIRQLDTMPAHPALDQYDAMSWFLTAYRAWYDRELGAFTTIRQAIIQILLRASRAHHVTQIQTALPSRDMNTYRYGLATQYIRDNYARPLALEEVATEIHISGRQLQRIFDEQAGETFSSYLEHYRLAQVCMALTYNDQTIEQLAILHGFSSGSYLHYVFKKRIGTTPQQYREQQRVNKLAANDHPIWQVPSTDK